MPCVSIGYNSISTVGSCCASSSSGSHVAITVTNKSDAATFPFKVYLDEWIPQDGFNWSGWKEVGWRTGTSKSSGTNVSMSPDTGGVTKTYRVRCHVHPDSNDNYVFTTASFTHKD